MKILRQKITDKKIEVDKDPNIKKPLPNEEFKIKLSFEDCLEDDALETLAEKCECGAILQARDWDNYW